MSGGWASSDRRQDLPRDWPWRRLEVLRRDPICTCPGCLRCSPVPNGPCVAASTDADHLNGRHRHTLADLAGKCSPCHRLKSSAEGNAARRGEQGPRSHPGRIG